MATGNSLIGDAFHELTVYGPSQSPQPADLAFGQLRLNALLDAMNIDGRILVAQEENIFLLGADVLSPTIGASGTFTATRPIKVPFANTIDLSDTSVAGTTATTGAGNMVLTDSGKNFTTLEVVAGRDLVYIISGTGVTAGIYRIGTVGTTTLTLTTNPGSSGSSISYRVIRLPQRAFVDTRHDLDWWSAVGNRGVVGTPCHLHYEPTYPNGVLNLYPLQDVPLGLELFTDVQFSQIANFGSTLSLAPGYYRMLVLELAEDMAPTYGKHDMLAVLKPKAGEARARVKSVNKKPPQLDTSIPGSGGYMHGFVSVNGRVYRA